MNATQQGEFHCSCGRSFMTEIKLQRHYKITNHLPIGEVEQVEQVLEVSAASEPAFDENEAYEMALRLIAEKRRDIEEAESRRRAEQLARAFKEEQRRQLDSFLAQTKEQAKSTGRACVKKAARAGSVALAVTTLTLLAVVLTSIGANIGKAMAQQHNSSSHLVAYR
jgi:septum formation inhibitor MinC